MGVPVSPLPYPTCWTQEGRDVEVGEEGEICRATCTRAIPAGLFLGYYQRP